MTTVAKTLLELQIGEWVLRGDPQNENDFLQMFRKIDDHDENGIGIENDDSSTWGVTWAQVKVKLDELVAASALEELRNERDTRLREVDYITLRAYSQGIPVPAEWAAYQQALRDITNTSTSLDDAVWPTKPE
jgi:hypothetical protein